MSIFRYLCLAILAVPFCMSSVSSAYPSQDQAKEQKVLVNQDVLVMLKSGLPPEIVAAKIRASHCNFNTDVPTLKDLKDKGVPDNVVLAMVEAPHYAQAPSDGKIRVFVTDSQSWEVRGGWGAANGSGGGAEAGGARPQTAEIIKTFTERCPDVVVTNKPDMANYAVTLDHEGGKGALRKDNKVAVFRRNGDAILSKSTRELGNAVKDACSAILSDAHLAPTQKN
jgi:hypothetical protein